MTEQSNLKFAFINEVFNENNKEVEPLSFDVITSGSNTFGLVTINFKKTDAELTGFNWEVCPQTSGSTNPLKGCVFDTNVSSFVFPIKNKAIDYFVQVLPSYKIVQSETPFGGLHPFVNLIPDNTNTTNTTNTTNSANTTNTSPNIVGERMFAIFYTSKLLTPTQAQEKKIPTPNKYDTFSIPFESISQPLPNVRSFGTFEPFEFNNCAVNVNSVDMDFVNEYKNLNVDAFCKNDACGFESIQPDLKSKWDFYSSTIEPDTIKKPIPATTTTDYSFNSGVKQFKLWDLRDAKENQTTFKVSPGCALSLPKFSPKPFDPFFKSPNTPFSKINTPFGQINTQPNPASNEDILKKFEKRISLRVNPTCLDEAKGTIDSAQANNNGKINSIVGNIKTILSTFDKNIEVQNIFDDALKMIDSPQFSDLFNSILNQSELPQSYQQSQPSPASPERVASPERAASPERVASPELSPPSSPSFSPPSPHQIYKISYYNSDTDSDTDNDSVLVEKKMFPSTIHYY